uniref:Uncharacterized protein n=1 Tax=uncultured Sphingobacterium sp. EB080_L08E11 TaxID=710992 RepID=E0Y0K1_9SPHI|nr:hypothetical protein [uncultured Sphingobacterium sp. EB080_L08E11]
MAKGVGQCVLCCSPRTQTFFKQQFLRRIERILRFPIPPSQKNCLLSRAVWSRTLEGIGLMGRIFRCGYDFFTTLCIGIEKSVYFRNPKERRCYYARN